MSFQPSNLWTLHTDTFTSVGNGTIVDMSSQPMKHYAVLVTAENGTPASWDVRLEGAIDNNTFTSILTHTGIVGINVTLFSKADVFPSLQIRSRVVSIVLAPATSITVTILGIQ